MSIENRGNSKIAVFTVVEEGSTFERNTGMYDLFLLVFVNVVDLVPSSPQLAATPTGTAEDPNDDSRQRSNSEADDQLLPSSKSVMAAATESVVYYL